LWKWQCPFGNGKTHDDDDDDELNLQPVHCKSNTLSVSSVTWPFNSKITCMQTT